MHAIWIWSLPPPARVTACRWQGTAKHVCTVRMWLCLKWCDMVHGCMVYTERAETAAVSRGTSHVTTKHSRSTPLGSIFKTCNKKKRYSHSFRMQQERNESAPERRIALHKSVQQRRTEIVRHPRSPTTQPVSYTHLTLPTRSTV